MRNPLKSSDRRTRRKFVIAFWLICIMIHISFHALAQYPAIIFTKEGEKPIDALTNETKIQLIQCKAELKYPKSVERFYRKRGYRLAWVEKNNHSSQLAAAMTILDCVLQFGLNKEDFHPNELIYNRIQVFTEQPDVIGNNQRAIFDVLLTDAMITFMNHLHYGKFNSILTPLKIDEANPGNFIAEITLSVLMESKDFYKDIVSVQPSSKEYDDLQKYMHLVRGQYLEDSYEFPEKNVRKMTVNMERLRWLAERRGNELFINIPAYVAKLKLKDSVHNFEIVVGKVSSPTPEMESAITHFNTAPEWKVPSAIFYKEILPKAMKNIDYLENNHYAIYNAQGKFVEIDHKKLIFIKAHPKQYFARQSSGCDNALGKIVFRFANTYDIYLHDTPQPKLFLVAERALSHGCIRIDQAEKLARVILTQDGSSVKIAALHQSMKSYQPKTFVLKRPLPIKIVYLTCEMIDSQLVIYNDIYSQDRGLEMAMYGYDRLLASDKKISIQQ